MIEASGYIRFESQYDTRNHKITYEIDNADIEAKSVVVAFTEFMLAMGYARGSVEAAMISVIEDTELLC